LIVSRNLEGAVRSGSCATTPERTTLYSPALIAEINASFTTYAGRLPTIFEFLEAVNFGDVVYDVPGWRNNLQAFAASKFHAPKPPAVGYYLNGRALTATPIVQGATYSWVIDNLGTKDGSAMFVGVPATEIPKYDYTRYLRGYLKATLNKGTSLEISDVAIVETSIFIRGWCSSGPDQACR
jgi:hypothetical protein